MEQSQQNSKLLLALLADLRSSKFRQTDIVSTYYLDQQSRTQRDTATLFGFTDEWISQVLKRAKLILANNSTQTRKIFAEIWSLLEGSCMNLRDAHILLIERGYISKSTSIGNMLKLYEVIHCCQPDGLFLVDDDLKINEGSPTILLSTSSFKQLQSDWRRLSKMANNNGVGQLALGESSLNNTLIQFIKVSSSIVSWTSESSLLFVPKHSRLVKAAETSFSISKSIPLDDLSFNMRRTLRSQTVDKKASFGYPSIDQVVSFLRHSSDAEIDESSNVYWTGKRAKLSPEQKIIVRVVSTRTWKREALLNTLKQEMKRNNIMRTESWLKKQVGFGSLILVDVQRGKRLYSYSLININGAPL